MTIPPLLLVRATLEQLLKSLKRAREIWPGQFSTGGLFHWGLRHRFVRHVGWPQLVNVHPLTVQRRCLVGSCSYLVYLWAPLVFYPVGTYPAGPLGFQSTVLSDIACHPYVISYLEFTLRVSGVVRFAVFLCCFYQFASDCFPDMGDGGYGLRGRWRIQDAHF